MSGIEWIGIIGIVATGVVALVAANRNTIERLLGKRLDSIESGINSLHLKSDNHHGRITRVETILEVNGCFGSEPGCDRRKEPR